MKIKLKTTMAGPDGSHSAGAAIEITDAQARDLIAGGFAESCEQSAPETVSEISPVEVATIEPEEQAADIGRRRGRRP